MLDNVRHTLMCSAAKEACTTTKQDLRENEHDANTPIHMMTTNKCRLSRSWLLARAVTACCLPPCPRLSICSFSPSCPSWRLAYWMGDNWQPRPRSKRGRMGSTGQARGTEANWIDDATSVKSIRGRLILVCMFLLGGLVGWFSDGCKLASLVCV